MIRLYGWDNICSKLNGFVVKITFKDKTWLDIRQKITRKCTVILMLLTTVYPWTITRCILIWLSWSDTFSHYHKIMRHINVHGNKSSVNNILRLLGRDNGDVCVVSHCKFYLHSQQKFCWKEEEENCHVNNLVMSHDKFVSIWISYV